MLSFVVGEYRSKVRCALLLFAVLTVFSSSVYASTTYHPDEFFDSYADAVAAGQSECTNAGAGNISSGWSIYGHYGSEYPIAPATSEAVWASGSVTCGGVTGSAPVIIDFLSSGCPPGYTTAANGECTPPLLDRGTATEVTASDPATLGPGECLGGTSYLRAAPIIQISPGNYSTVMESTGEACSPSNDTSFSAVTPNVNCVVDQAAVQFCAQDILGTGALGDQLSGFDKNCGTVNGVALCVDTISQNSCGGLSDGSEVCGPSAPDSLKPDNGTAGTPATPTTQIGSSQVINNTNTVTNYDYFSSSVVNSSSNNPTAPSAPVPVSSGGNGSGTGTGAGNKQEIDWGSFTAPTLDTTGIDTASSDFYSAISSAPIVSAVAGLGASIGTGTCPTWTIDVPYLQTTYTIDEVCTFWPDVVTVLSPIMLVVWSVAGIRILMSA